MLEAGDPDDDEIPDAEAFVDLVIDRDVRVLYIVGEKTAQKLNLAGIYINSGRKPIDLQSIG